MKVLILKTNEEKELESSYAARLIEQGKAIVKAEKTEAKEAPAEETKPKGKKEK